MAAGRGLQIDGIGTTDNNDAYLIVTLQNLYFTALSSLLYSRHMNLNNSKKSL